MKKFIKHLPVRTSTIPFNVKSRSKHLPRRLFALILPALVSVVLLAGCKKEDANQKNIQDQLNKLDSQTAWELQQAKEASTRYQDIQNAFTDGYADINVVMPNMGYHYMKSALVDTIFEIRKPEILVYNKKSDGGFQLVAVEYAVPIDKSPNAAPEGFTGTADVWKRDTGFGLWLLHAWVWTYNPDGIFKPMNPQVVVR